MNNLVQCTHGELEKIIIYLKRHRKPEKPTDSRKERHLEVEQLTSWLQFKITVRESVGYVRSACAHGRES